MNTYLRFGCILETMDGQELAEVLTCSVCLEIIVRIKQSRYPAWGIGGGGFAILWPYFLPFMYKPIASDASCVPLLSCPSGKHFAYHSRSMMG